MFCAFFHLPGGGSLLAALSMDAPAACRASGRARAAHVNPLRRRRARRGCTRARTHGVERVARDGKPRAALPKCPPPHPPSSSPHNPQLQQPPASFGAGAPGFSVTASRAALLSLLFFGTRRATS